jgi:hypothetical protein
MWVLVQEATKRLHIRKSSGQREWEEGKSIVIYHGNGHGVRYREYIQFTHTLLPCTLYPCFKATNRGRRPVFESGIEAAWRAENAEEEWRGDSFPQRVYPDGVRSGEADSQMLCHKHQRIVHHGMTF